MAKFRKGQSGNPGGRPKVLSEIQELARQQAPSAIAELVRLSIKAKSETARISAIRELLDRGYGKARQSVEVCAPEIEPMKLLLEEIGAANRNEPRHYNSQPDTCLALLQSGEA
jgi:hypothetical protein